MRRDQRLDWLAPAAPVVGTSSRAAACGEQDKLPVGSESPNSSKVGVPDPWLVLAIQKKAQVHGHTVLNKPDAV